MGCDGGSSSGDEQRPFPMSESFNRSGQARAKAVAQAKVQGPPAGFEDTEPQSTLVEIDIVQDLLNPAVDCRPDSKGYSSGARGDPTPGGGGVGVATGFDIPVTARVRTHIDREGAGC